MIEILFTAILFKWEIWCGVVAGVVIYHLCFNNQSTKSTTKPQSSTRPTTVTQDEDNHVFQDTDTSSPEVFETDDFDEIRTRHVPFNPSRYSEEDMLERSRKFYEEMNKRRSCRFISKESVPLDIVANIIRTAG